MLLSKHANLEFVLSISLAYAHTYTHHFKINHFLQWLRYCCCSKDFVIKFRTPIRIYLISLQLGHHCSEVNRCSHNWFVFLVNYCLNLSMTELLIFDCPDEYFWFLYSCDFYEISLLIGFRQISAARWNSFDHWEDDVIFFFAEVSYSLAIGLARKGLNLALLEISAPQLENFYGWNLFL